MSAAIRIDDHELPLVRPATAEELADVVRAAAGRGQAIYPVGGATALDYGGLPGKPGIAVELTGLDRVIDYPARDLTVTVEAGIRVGRLQGLLRGEGQRLAVDVPTPERATLGGAVSCDASGPRRHGHGTFRDWVIGATVVTDRGTLASAGGRVVKNVAGYDLGKLYTGALGTLGILTQMTLKLQPRPEAASLVSFSVTSVELNDVLTAVNDSQTRPCGLELLNATAAQVVNATLRRSALPTDADWTLTIGYEDNADAVRWQLQRIRDELRRDGTVHPDADAAAICRALIESPAVSDSVVSLRAGLRPSAVAAFALTCPADARVHAHAGRGAVRVGWPAVDRSAFAALHAELLRAAGTGNVVIRRCPVDWKRDLPVWGRFPASIELMHEVKRRLDPAGCLNPGRFVTG